MTTVFFGNKVSMSLRGLTILVALLAMVYTPATRAGGPSPVQDPVAERMALEFVRELAFAAPRSRRGDTLDPVELRRVRSEVARVQDKYRAGQLPTDYLVQVVSHFGEVFSVNPSRTGDTPSRQVFDGGIVMVTVLVKSESGLWEVRVAIQGAPSGSQIVKFFAGPA